MAFRIFQSGTEAEVNPALPNNTSNPTVTALANNTWAVISEEQVGANDHNLRQTIFAANGTVLSTSIVATAAQNEVAPYAATLIKSGSMNGHVVVWQSETEIRQDVLRRQREPPV